MNDLIKPFKFRANYLDFSNYNCGSCDYRIMHLGEGIRSQCTYKKKLQDAEYNNKKLPLDFVNKVSSHINEHKAKCNFYKQEINIVDIINTSFFHIPKGK